MIRVHAFASEGQRRLAELQLSQRKLANAVGASHQTCWRWLRGDKAPAPAHRQKIAEVFGIAPELWDLAPLPGADAPTTLGEDLRRAAETRLEAIRSVETAAAATELPDNAAGLEALIAQCRAARGVPSVAPTTLARLAAVEISAVNAREKLRHAVEVAQASPEWAAHYRRLHNTLANALRDHPLALIATMIAIGEWDSGGSAAAAQACDALASVEREHAPEVAAVRIANEKLVEAMIARRDGRPRAA